MTVSRRLLLVALLCLLPTLAAGLFTQFDLRWRRSAELAELAMRQAELSAADIHSVHDAARQLGQTIARLNPARNGAEECARILTRLGADMTHYAFLALFNLDGSPICASLPGMRERPGWLLRLLTATDAAVGNVAREAPVPVPFLPIVTPLLGPEGTRDALVVVGLDLDWLSRRAGVMLTGAEGAGTLLIADRQGNLIAGYPAQGIRIGQPLAPELIALLGHSQPGTITLSGGREGERLVAYVPPAKTRDPVLVTYAIPISVATAEIDRIALRAALIAGSASLIALILALAAGEAFIRRPTERLLRTAQALRDGDLSARAAIPEETSEFGRLGRAFNEMAETLEQREAERKNAAALLESRVAARTRELSETNNRLQVEISEREKTEAALAQAQKLQAVGRLAGGIAHDFNNLLATILGNLELMERRVGEHDDRLLALIRRASSAVSRGAQLTARLLAFSRRHRPIVQPTDVNKLITDLLTLASSTLGRRITVQSNLAPNLWPALIDANQVEAAILNLALNARDAMPGGGTLTFSTANETVEIARDGLAPGDYVRVDVTDTGTGMSEEVMRRAFEPFFTTKGPGGSGLGLSQVYGVANQTGGGVRIRSAPGAGTTVSMLLPRAVADADLIGAPRQRRRIEGAPRVLLIDDDRPVRQATAEMLRDLGCDVVEAPAGEEGLDILHAEGARIGLMIVDYAMPGLNGLEVAVRVRRMARRVPILIVTGYAELDDSSGPGFDAIAGVLHKPFTINELETAITRAIAAPVHI